MSGDFKVDEVVTASGGGYAKILEWDSKDRHLYIGSFLEVQSLVVKQLQVKQQVQQPLLLVVLAKNLIGIHILQTLRFLEMQV